MDRSNVPCKHINAEGVCGATPTRLYLTGHKCLPHSPAALNGRTIPVPDPALTLAGLRAAGGANPDAAYTPASPTKIDSAAIASGKRRSNPADYQQAVADRGGLR